MTRLRLLRLRRQGRWTGRPFHPCRPVLRVVRPPYDWTKDGGL